MKKNKWVILSSLFLSSLIALPGFAAENERTVEERLNRIERLVNNKGLVEIMLRIESVQSELQHLVGEIELQKHTLGGIKKRQRDLYLDIDRRLLQLERRSGSGQNSRISNKPLISDEADETENTIAVDPSVNSNVTVKPPKARVGVNDTKNEQAAYQSAFDLLRALRYEKATQAFRQFLNDYPDGRYAHIAQYWLAETSYHTRKYDIAVKDYQDLINQYPKSPKLADALLKIGYSQFELKAFAKSKKVLRKLIKTYPRTTEAGQAENLLQKIRLQKVR